jgi:pimeloyl-ACP methyl ester carboxylesterase
VSTAVGAAGPFSFARPRRIPDTGNARSGSAWTGRRRERLWPAANNLSHVTRRGRTLTVFVVALALIASGCSLVRRDRSPTPAASAGAGPWRDCSDQARERLQRKPRNVTYECSTITVPRDWTASAAAGTGATGDTFKIALLRARASGQRDRIGSLVVNPGGPGGSGVDLAIYLSVGLPAEVTRRFDIVGFDPRGVGRSTEVKCLSDEILDESFGYDPDPVSPPAFEGAVVLTRRMGQSCAAKYGDELRLFSTEQAARDIDAVRRAVGDAKLTYLGYSYGTLLGATYAQLFPKNIRAFVLDGAVDPKQGFVASSESQAKGFERAFGNFVEWCRTSTNKCALAPDARAAVTAALEAGRRNPVRGPDGRRATAGWIFTAVVSSLYTQQSWADLARAVLSLGTGDPRGIFELADRYTERDSSGRYTNLFDANSAINCSDTDEKLTVPEIRALQSRWRSKYPLFGAPLAVGLLGCAQWPAARDPYPVGPATGAPPIVVIGTTGDPATPYEQTPKLAEMLGVGRVLTWRGEGHTAYPETRCITEAVNAYLIDLKVPEDGETCPAK